MSIPKADTLYKPLGFNTWTIVLYSTAVTTDSTTGEVTVTLNRNKAWIENAFTYFTTKNQTEGTNYKVDVRLHTDLLYIKENGQPINIFEKCFSDVDWLDYDVFSGFFIADEPSFPALDVIDTVYVPWFNENYGGTRLEFFVNMLSGYSTAMGGLRDVNGNLVTNNGTYKTGGNINGLYQGSPAYSVATGQLVTVQLTDQEKADMTTAYHNKWLSIFAKVNSANKCFSHDVYPFFDNQPGKIILTDVVDKDGNVVMTAEQLKALYLAMDQNFTTDTILTEKPDGYQYVFLDEWLSRSLNMAILAKNNNYDYGACIQAFDQGGTGYGNHKYRAPETLAEIRWQVYMNIAMGAKKINYFAFGQGDNGEYMTVDLNPTPIYVLVQQANEELNRVDHVFASFETWVGLKTYGATGSNTLSAGLQMVADRGQNLQSLTGVSSVTTSKELVVGEMIDGNGNHGYMLVGYGDPMLDDGTPTQVSMTFDGAAGFIVYRNGERTLVEAQGDGVFSTTLEAGDGVFVIPVYEE